MNKKLLAILITGGVIIAVPMFVYLSNGRKPLNEPKKIIISSAKKDVTQKIAEQDLESPDKKNDEAKEIVTDKFLISEHLDEISSQIKKLNDFNNPTEDYYNNIKTELANLNVTMHENTKALFGVYDNSDLVVVGIILNSKLRQVNQNYFLDLTVRTGQSPNVNGSKVRNEVAKELRQLLSSERYNDYNKIVSYKLLVSENGENAELMLESEKWW